MRLPLHPIIMPSAASPHAAAAADLALIAAMKDRGRRAAADDGWYLLLWGTLGAVIVVVQYVAEVRDWAPSVLLWWWQPVFLLCALLGAAFVVTGLVSELRWLAGVGAGWWALMAYFTARGALVPMDFLVLAAAVALLVAAPGLWLVRGARHVPVVEPV